MKSPRGDLSSLDPENNALISLNPFKKIPESIFPLVPKSLKINSASPQIPKNISQFSLKCIFLSIGLNSHT